MKPDTVALDRAELERLAGVAISSGVASPERRSLLLGSMPTEVVASLPLFPSPATQLLSDLSRLNRMTFSNGRPALAIWLENARALLSHNAYAKQQIDSVLDATQRAAVERVDGGSVGVVHSRTLRGDSRPDRPSAGLVLDERWQLQELVGRGGFASVWRAKGLQDGELVAVKILHPQFSDSVMRRERFFRGARLMARLDHPNIVRVLSSEGSEDWLYYFTMEWMAGGDLDQAVGSKSISSEDALVLICDVADAVAYAHRYGVIHRDIKPSNILLDGSGTAKLSDFDLVRAAGTTGGTRTGGLGTFIYAAPESMEDASRVGPTCDVYSLGMTALFALVGSRLPREALRDPKSILEKTSASEKLKQVILRAIDWEESERHPDAEFFARDVRHALRGPVRRSDSLGQPPRSVLRPHQTRSSVESFDRSSFTLIPPGRFLMGADVSEIGRKTIEGPKREVQVSAGFYMAITPVTNQSFVRIMNMPHHLSGNALMPATNISWFDAVRYCNTLSQLHGLTSVYEIADRSVQMLMSADGYRLPTEAEWEYACRAGTSTGWWCGETVADLARVAWFKDNSGSAVHEVGLKPSNPFGLSDMHGNVWEWCWDWYGWYPRQPSTDPVGPANGKLKVQRGGCFADSATGIHSAARRSAMPESHDRCVGFRIVRSCA